MWREILTGIEVIVRVRVKGEGLGNGEGCGNGEAGGEGHIEGCGERVRVGIIRFYTCMQRDILAGTGAEAGPG